MKKSRLLCYKEIITKYEIVVSLIHEAWNANTWKGCSVTGKNLKWTALTYFKFNDKGLIIEEIVERNELVMAESLGIIKYIR